MKFQRKKITTSGDITKNVEGGRIPPPALLGLKLRKVEEKILFTMGSLNEFLLMMKPLFLSFIKLG